MKEEYDLSTMKSRPNPYAKQLKKQVTMRLETEVIEYFKKMAEDVGIADSGHHQPGQCNSQNWQTVRRDFDNLFTQLP